ncbi:MAG: HAD-IA family hydrolase [Burkholderiaceae bacterium]
MSETLTAPVVELVVFDFDGTLFDSTHAITQAIRAAAVDLGLPEPSRERASHVIGLGLADALRYAVPTLRESQVPAYIERYRFHWFQRQGELSAFDGIEALLDALAGRGVPLAIATGKSRIGLNRALEQVGWSRRFLTTRCADEGEPKPHPWMLRDISEETRIALERTVMIGDTTHDLDMARSAGAHAIAVTYGAHPAERLRASEPLAVVDDVAALQDILLTLTGSAHG